MREKIKHRGQVPKPLDKNYEGQELPPGWSGRVRSTQRPRVIETPEQYRRRKRAFERRQDTI